MFQVGKLQKQHQMLHTQEKILRYELAQKRKLLTQLKEELEYSREKWAQAREKNSTTEEQWKQLRTEFASRKNTLNDDSNNSAESGYSDDKECSSSDDEPSYDTDDVDNLPTNSNSRRNSNVSTKTLTMTNTEETTNDNATSRSSDPPNEEAIEAREVAVGVEEENAANEDTSNQVECSNDLPSNTTDEVVAKTWERVSDIVQKEILRLTDQVQKTDSNPTMLSVDDRLSGTSQETEKTDLNNVPSTSKGSSRTLEEVLAARNERFKRLEEQAQQLRNKVVNTNKRSDEMSSKLDSLHETYGQSVDSSFGGDVATENSQEHPSESVERSDENSQDD